MSKHRKQRGLSNHFAKKAVTQLRQVSEASKEKAKKISARRATVFVGSVAAMAVVLGVAEFYHIATAMVIEWVIHHLILYCMVD